MGPLFFLNPFNLYIIWKLAKNRKDLHPKLYQAILLWTFAVIVDIVQIGLVIAFGAGLLVNTLITWVVAILMPILFWLFGASFSKNSTNLLLELASLIIESFPAANILPIWTISTLMSIGTSWYKIIHANTKEEKLEKKLGMTKDEIKKNKKARQRGEPHRDAREEVGDGKKKPPASPQAGDGVKENRTTAQATITKPNAPKQPRQGIMYGKNGSVSPASAKPLTEGLAAKASVVGKVVGK